MEIKNIKELGKLSPFEIKDFLIQVAQDEAGRSMLNAGRGNPNFLATEPRHGFFQLGLFAMQEAERSFCFMPEGVGGAPKKEGIDARFSLFLSENKGAPGISFLRSAVSYVRDQLGHNEQDFIYEMCEALLGCNYPVPDRMLKMSEKIVAQYIRKEMIGNYHFCDCFDLFAVEGGTAAMTYLFNTLRENYLLCPGDKIALGTPIFTPYIEIPELNDYKLVEVSLEAHPQNDWQFTKKEMDKLLDPKIKAFFLVNPSNPPSVKISDENLKYLGEIVKKRPDLIILTDDVYGTFADNFVSLFAVAPYNTILVYSYSKYFGATGWRLGVIATAEKNLMDDKIAKLSDSTKKVLNTRYSSITTAPEKLKFIDRLVADSRTVALNHTAGLSTPVQVQMVLFSLFSLMDQADRYKDAMKRLVRGRKLALYQELGVCPEKDENSVDYYQLLDVETIGFETYGRPFVDWLLKTLQPNEFLFKLAKEAGVVLLPAKGFGTSHPSVRVSLANLNEADYVKIGKAIHKLATEYYAQYQKTGKAKK